jgi:hypothetical protein
MGVLSKKRCHNTLGLGSFLHAKTHVLISNPNPYGGNNNG